MPKEPFYKTYSRFLKYNNMSNWNPLKAPTIWANTNAMLDDFYSLPDVNITNNARGLNFKNSMRHFVGPAIMTQEYNPEFTRFMGGLKEARDFYFQQPLEDQLVDLRNNWRGIEYAKNNPNASVNDILKNALLNATQNYEQDYNSPTLFKLLIKND